jgi:glycosyltransferase involved in cell wall biosynthesis
VTAANDVATLAIPAFRAAGFIDRTLRCARAQTYADVHILVSIDRSDDDTEEICRAHARDDDRIEVVVHRDRLGWVGNVNHLLDLVRSEFAGIYFHDDVIEPTYVERLVGALRERTDAASAHCDVVLEDHSGTEKTRAGVDYEGTATERLLRYLIARERGALLRSMVRRRGAAGALRMSAAAVVYEMGLVAAGPARRVNQPLYRRWIERAGGLTVGLHRRPLPELIQGLRYNATMAQGVLDDIQPTASERELLEFGLALYMSNQLRPLETAYATPTLIDPSEVLGRPVAFELPPAVQDLPPELREMCDGALDRVRRRAEVQARRLSA